MDPTLAVPGRSPTGTDSAVVASPGFRVTSPSCEHTICRPHAPVAKKGQRGGQRSPRIASKVKRCFVKMAACRWRVGEGRDEGGYGGGGQVIVPAWSQATPRSEHYFILLVGVGFHELSNEK